ncbi:MAG: ABC transporter permease subunit [Eubacteriales bacterium]
MKENRLLTKREIMFRRMYEDRILYLMLAPTLIYFVLFRVLPILNMRLAFFDYKRNDPWEFAGTKYFDMIFATPAFRDILENTLIISFMKYILLFPLFVIFALLLNELRSSKIQKYVQVVSYLPHFLSWVVIAGIWTSALSSTGAVNTILDFFQLPSTRLLTDKEAIRWVLYWSEAWRSIGWDSIIYFTAILSISPSLFESAEIDGANRWDIVRFIIIPALIAPMFTVFILNLGFFLSAGFDQVFNFTNDAVNSQIDILDTYIYRVGLSQGNYSLATAVGLLKGVVGVMLVLGTHVVSKKITGKGVW